MNPRIQELIAKANGTPVELVEITSWTFAERLAELVVRECIDQCVHTNHNNQWDKGIAWAVGQIKQHFGVEE